MEPTTQAQQKNIVQTAIDAGNFKTLASALKSAGLVEVLKGPGPYTVFAPTDEAFAKLPKATLSELLTPEGAPRLKDILNYHVVPRKISAAQLKTMESSRTAQGREVAIRMEGTTVRVGGARVLKQDIACSNGVIHAIDTVLLPG